MDLGRLVKKVIYVRVGTEKEVEKNLDKKNEGNWKSIRRNNEMRKIYRTGKPQITDTR